MQNIKRALFICIMAVAAHAAHAVVPNFTGTTDVTEVSETAADAKARALATARRQIIRDTISPYADAAAFTDLLNNTDGKDLIGLILASRIDGERQSATTYTATVSMTVDGGAVRRWLDDAAVRNWLPDTATGGRALVVVTLRNRLADWVELNAVARGENVDMDTRNISGNQVTLEIPERMRSMFTAALSAAGWHYAADDAALRIWK